MATFVGEDRHGRFVTLVDNGQELLPLTLREYELIRDLRRVEDMQRRSRDEPSWDLSDAEQLELSIRIAVQHVAPPDSGWTLLSPEESSLARDAIKGAQAGLPEGRYQRDCWALVMTRFSEVK